MFLILRTGQNSQQQQFPSSNRSYETRTFSIAIQQPHYTDQNLFAIQKLHIVINREMFPGTIKAIVIIPYDYHAGIDKRVDNDLGVVFFVFDDGTDIIILSLHDDS
jgi:hypothetical protein